MPAMRRTVLTLTLVCAVGPGIGACGPSSDSAEDDVRAVLDRAFVSFDADACSEILTQRALEQTQFTDAEDALESCIDDAEDPDDNAEAIEIPELEVNADTATATVTPQGGSIDGASMSVALVEDDGWRIDRVTALEILDRDRFLDAGLAEIVEDDSLLGGQGRCIDERVRSRVTDSELEGLYVDKDPSFLYDAIRACVGDGTDFGTISALLRQDLTEVRGFSRAQADCVIARLRPVIERYTIENFDEVADDERFRAAAAAAGAICVGPEGPQGTPPPEPQ
ncbi:MAG: hypothetical protein ACRDKX_04720 [Solirubrobacterales bacterium]